MRGQPHFPPYKQLMAVCFAWVFGVFVHSLRETLWLTSLGWLAAGTVLLAVVSAVTLRKPGRLQIATLLLAVAAVAVFRFDLELSRVPRWVEPPSGTQRFSGVVRSVQGDGVRVIVDDVVLGEGTQPPNFGVMVSGYLPFEALPGDKVDWSCTAAPFADDSNEGGRLMNVDRVGWRCRTSRLAVTSEGGFSVARALAVARGSMRQLIREMMPPTEATLLMGLLAGERADLPRSLSDSFRDTGTTHILAVSGYNIAQVTAAVLVALASLRFARKKAVIWSAACVIGFTVFVGCGASVVRAALMGGLALGAARLERRYDSGVGLALAAAVMLAVSPLSLRHDLGLQLSFAAVLGLRFFSPTFSAGLTKLLPRFFANPLADSLAAVLATLPVALRNFGVLSLVSPVANVCVAPLVPYAMLSGVAAGVMSFLVPPLASVFGLVPWILLKSVVTIVTVIGRVPTVEIYVDTLGFVSMTVALSALAWRLRRVTIPGRRFL